MMIFLSYMICFKTHATDFVLECSHTVALEICEEKS